MGSTGSTARRRVVSSCSNQRSRKVLKPSLAVVRAAAHGKDVAETHAADRPGCSAGWLMAPTVTSASRASRSAGNRSATLLAPARAADVRESEGEGEGEGEGSAMVAPRLSPGWGWEVRAGARIKSGSSCGLVRPMA